jgi:hypothetical protein
MKCCQAPRQFLCFLVSAGRACVHVANRLLELLRRVLPFPVSRLEFLHVKTSPRTLERSFASRGTQLPWACLDVRALREISCCLCQLSRCCRRACRSAAERGWLHCGRWMLRRGRVVLHDVVQLCAAAIWLASARRPKRLSVACSSARLAFSSGMASARPSF